MAFNYEANKKLGNPVESILKAIRHGHKINVTESMGGRIKCGHATHIKKTSAKAMGELV